MSAGPVVAMVWEGRDAVKTGRVMLGATKPLESAPGIYLHCNPLPNIFFTYLISKGTIRGDYAIDVGRNICHGSDSVESAEKEIKL